jgi:hypothetical protein
MGWALAVDLSRPELILLIHLSIWPPSLMAVGRSAYKFLGCEIMDFKMAMTVRVRAQPYFPNKCFFLGT